MQAQSHFAHMRGTTFAECVLDSVYVRRGGGGQAPALQGGRALSIRHSRQSGESFYKDSASTFPSFPRKRESIFLLFQVRRLCYTPTGGITRPTHWTPASAGVTERESASWCRHRVICAHEGYNPRRMRPEQRVRARRRRGTSPRATRRAAPLFPPYPRKRGLHLHGQRLFLSVIPAKAGIHLSSLPSATTLLHAYRRHHPPYSWTPASAGVTERQPASWCRHRVICAQRGTTFAACVLDKVYVRRGGGGQAPAQQGGRPLSFRHSRESGNPSSSLPKSRLHAGEAGWQKPLAANFRTHTLTLLLTAP